MTLRLERDNGPSGCGGKGGIARIDNRSLGRDNINTALALSAGVTQLVECNLAKVDVAGSNPVSRSKTPFRNHRSLWARLV